MARPKSSNAAAIIGLVLLAIVAGVYIGTSIYNEPKGTPMPAPPKVDLNDKYNDEWGKLATADSAWKATHILVSWTGISGVTIKQPRTKDDARKLIDEIWAKYRVNPTDENWTKLQAQYNEDSGAHNKYDNTQSLVDPFKNTAKTTKKGFARVVESQFGFHLIRREG